MCVNECRNTKDVLLHNGVHIETTIGVTKMTKNDKDEQTTHILLASNTIVVIVLHKGLICGIKSSDGINIVLIPDIIATILIVKADRSSVLPRWYRRGNDVIVIISFLFLIMQSTAFFSPLI